MRIDAHQHYWQIGNFGYTWLTANMPQLYHDRLPTNLTPQLAANGIDATVVIQARLQDMSPQLEEAAMDLGARPHQVFWLVTLPLIWQSLLSAWLLTFTISLDDVVLSAFLSGPGSTTMPLVIFSRARLGLNPSVNAVATIIVAVVELGVLIASYWIARTERRRQTELAAASRA